MSLPILIVGDAVDQNSGLARITRDLCTLLAASPDWNVASLGWLGIGTSRLPWMQYAMSASAPTTELALQATLPMAVDDHFKGKAGIVMTLWDLSRLLWLAQPHSIEYDDQLRDWLLHARTSKFKLWSYCPIDSLGPAGRLTLSTRDTLLGIDRILTMSPFGEATVRATIGEKEAESRGVEWLPHAMNGKTFNLGGRDGDQDGGDMDRSLPDPADDHAHDDVQKVIQIGVVMTNQQRKEWGTVAVVCAELAKRLPTVKFWWHVDQPIRHWNLMALIVDFGLTAHVHLTTGTLTDKDIASRYRACDLTLHTGSEGFGYPIFESLACGTPAIHGDYAGGASIMRTCGLDHYLVQPAQWRLEGQYNCLRPVYDPQDWVQKVIDVLSIRPDRQWLADRVTHLMWSNISGRWLKWFREGIS
jgi:glycosyltransferase involved in cell wall biosynthesis